MSGVKKSRAVDGKKKKITTSSSRRHQFESFNQRVAKLSIDPVRRVHNKNIDDEDSDPTKSYFRDAFLYWKDINLSETFMRFVQDVEPLCDNLHQVLHHRSRIIELLHQNLEKRESLSLEPLLSLQAHLAHDLGTRFEEFFHTTLGLVLSIASKHPDVEVIEWSFSCLAWLFKYLSRLLVPDLRATYDIVSSALGKENHKPFIARFAAEAMSFLLRKAAAAFQKNQNHLELIVGHILRDISIMQGTKDMAGVYLYGVMSLFANSIKGVESGFYSHSLNIYRCMLESVSQHGGTQIANGVTIDLIHHANGNSFAPILETVCGSAMLLSADAAIADFELYSGLLFTIVAVRKGSRVLNWRSILDSIAHLVGTFVAAQDPSGSKTMSLLGSATAATFQTAPFDLLLAFVRIVETLLQKCSAIDFLAFCVNFNELHRDRFEQFVKPQFFKYVAVHWADLESELLHATHMIQRKPDQSQTSGARRNSRSTQVCPQLWQETIASKFERDSPWGTSVSVLQAYLDLIESLEFQKPTKMRILYSLQHHIQVAWGNELATDEKTKLLLGAGFRFVLQSGESNVIAAEWSRVVGACETFSSMPIYLENVLSLIETATSTPADDALDAVAAIAIRNLASFSKDLRVVSLRLLAVLSLKRDGSEPDFFKVALDIERLPLEVQSARTGSMYVRRIAAEYRNWSSNRWVARAIPHFCFGLLHFKLSPLWDDAIDAIRSTLCCRLGEEAVTDLVFTWLECATSSGHQSAKSTDVLPKTKSRPNEFQCANLAHVEEAMLVGYDSIRNVSQRLRDNFDRLHHVVEGSSPNCRSQALRVLKGIPDLAEKRSRRLVPFFLQSLGSGTYAHFHTESDEMEESSSRADTGKCVITRSELKAMLDVFGCFTNPRVLYRATDVHAEILKLLAIGDVQIQKAALAALLAWKSNPLEACKENLFNLLDEARFREELTVSIRADENGNFLKDEAGVEVLPVLLRLLYGRIISRQGATSGKNSLGSKRRAVFYAIAGLSDNAIQDFVSIALGPLLNLRLKDKRVAFEEPFDGVLLTPRQEVGLVNLFKDMLDVMGDRLTFCLSSLVKAVLFCSQKSLSALALSRGNEDEEAGSAASPKALRRSATQCLLLLFKRFPPNELEVYLPSIFDTFICPRLANLAAEAGQSVSGLLELFSVWAESPDMASYMADHDPRVLPSLISILTSASAQDSVKIFVINKIMRPIASLASQEKDIGSVAGSRIRDQVLAPYAETTLEAVGSLLRGSPSKQVLGSSIELVSLMSRSIQGSNQIRGWLDLSSFLLRQPSGRVSPRAKGNMLEAILHFVPLSGCSPSDDLLYQLANSLNPLFGYFKDRDNRVKLADTLAMISSLEQSFESVAGLCKDLNAYSVHRIDAPDFDKRFQAFQRIDAVVHDLSPEQLTPIVYNMLFFIQDTEELALRASASHCLKQVLRINHMSGDSSSEGFKRIRSIILDALREGVTSPSELVRAEYLSVFAELLRWNPQWNEVNDLVPLLMGDDEEASFFANILHLQQHRRLRALRRLAIQAESGSIRSSNVAHFLVPLLEHFLSDSLGDSSAHNLTAEAIKTIGALAESLEWPQFRAVFRRYMSYLQNRAELEKPTAKLLNMLAEAMSVAASAKSKVVAVSLGCEEDSAEKAASHSLSCLARTMPRQERISQDLCVNLIGPLLDYVHHKDETMVSQRMPIAITVVKLLKLLPSESFTDRLPPVLTDICQILRSRAQESRDLTRKTLTEISQMIGPGYLQFILKELRSALPRGYQLHVLSFTVHSILVANEPMISHGDLDYCLNDIVAIVMDDIFGVTGQEKDAEDYISKMKEVKSNKSYDSMELLAKVTTMTKVNQLVGPLRALLGERLDLRSLKKIDELFRRTGTGLLHNEKVGSREGLVLCYELLQQVYEPKERVAAGPKETRLQRFHVKLRHPRNEIMSDRTTSHVYKLARFSLDLLRTILNKHESLKTPQNLSGFMRIIGESFISAREEVQVSSMRLLATIIKVPLKDIDMNAPVYVAEAVKLIKNATSTNTESAQAALKLIAGVLRERPAVQIRDVDLAYLLQIVKSDLEEPDRQGVTFNFLKAVLQRKILVTEVYEILDSVSAMMVTNQSVGARNMARGLYIQFFINYPQTKVRLKKQLAFLVKNLSYQYVEGRQSVMETLHQLLERTGEDIVQNIAGTFFAPLVLVTINDESADCRRMASTLLKNLLRRADDERLLNALVLLRNWINQGEQILLTRIALQTYTIYLEVHPTRGERELSFLQQRLQRLLKNVQLGESKDWETVYFSLQLFAKICQMYPQSVYRADVAALWDLITQASTFPHTWVKLASARLLGKYFADFARLNAGQAVLKTPLLGSAGLELSFDSMVNITKASLRSLKVPGISEELANQLVKNLAFVARLFAAIEGSSDTDQTEDPIGETNGSDSEEGEEDDDVSGRALTEKPLRYTFRQISSILRREPVTTKAPSLIPKTATIQLLAALCYQLPMPQLSMHLPMIIQPLYHLTDVTITGPVSLDKGFIAAQDALVSSAHETISVLQKKLGTTDFIKVMAEARKTVEERRNERRTKRRIEAVADPERAGTKRSKKHVKERLRRKERNSEQRSRRRGW